MSIEFSIEWKEKLDFQFEEIEGYNIRPAFLCITYRNISDKPLYCLKVTDGVYDLPIIMVLLKLPLFNKGKKLLRSQKYYTFNYTVGFESNPFYYPGLSWNIDDFNIHLVTDDYYNYIYSFYYPSVEWENKVQLAHDPLNITQDTIKNESLNKFVFLKPGEKHVDKFNLIGFQMAGGTITFQLNNTKSRDFVKIDCENMSSDETDNEYDLCVNKQLPLKVGEYELFTGNFLSNKVRVYFSGIQQKE